MNFKTIPFFLIVGLIFGVTSLSMSEPAIAKVRNPKIHVLFVWGTNAVDTRQVTVNTKKTFESGMASIGICPNGKYISSFTSLSGDKAHPKYILQQCKRMAQQAGEDDALFVYILCHGRSVHLNDVKKTPQNLIHALSPVAPNSDNMNLSSIGIKRSSIIKAMKSGKHRLNVLITDSPSLYTDSVHSLLRPRAIPSCLMYILLNNSGTINWSSTDPVGDNLRQGELSLGNADGAIFSSVFIRISSSSYKNDKSRITISDLFNRLGSALVDASKDTQRKIFRSGGRQKQQTLTEFDDDGHVIRRWNEKTNRVRYQ